MDMRIFRLLDFCYFYNWIYMRRVIVVSPNESTQTTNISISLHQKARERNLNHEKRFIVNLRTLKNEHKIFI